MNARRVLLPLLLSLSPWLSPPAARAEDPADVLRRSFTAAPGGKLVLKADRGTLTLSGSDTETAEITVTRKVKGGSADKARQLLAEHQVTFEQKDGVIRVEADLKGQDSWNPFGRRLEVEIEVHLPRKFDVEASTAGGSIRASHLQGSVQLQTSGGSVQLESIEGTLHARTSGGSIRAASVNGAVELGTAGGSIQVEGARGEKLKASTSGGSIRAAGLEVPADLQTSGGSLRIEASGAALNASTSGGSIDATFTSAPTGNIQLKTSAGGIGVVLPAAAAFQLDASTSAGSVRSDFPVSTSTSTEARSQLKGDVNGGGPSLKLRTSAGSIRIKKA